MTTTSTSENGPSVLHVLAPATAGGLESVVATLAHGQVRHGFDVRVASIVTAGSPEPHLHARLRESGVELSVLELPARAYAVERRELARIIGTFRPGVVHTHGYRPDVLAGGVARRLAAGTVTTVHGFTGGGWKNRVYEFLQVRAFRRFDAVVAVSRPIASRLERAGVPPALVQVVPNAHRIDPPPLERAAARRELGLADGATCLGWVGRLSREKGFDVLLEALARLPDPAVRVSVIGAGPDQPRMEALAQRLGLAGRIAWHGLLPRAARLYRAFDLFVLSSRTEGTPISLFEAMAAGIPAVVTRVGGVPDVVTPDHAWLVPPEDPGALAGAIAGALADPEEAGRRAAAATRRLAAAYSVDAWVDRYAAIYRAAADASISRNSP